MNHKKQESEEIVLYISPNGSDKSPGTEKTPLKSLEKALHMTNGKKSTLILKKGIHYLNKTILLGPENSDLTITGAEGAKATVSGGHLINSPWTVYRDNILQCSLSGEWEGDQLYVEGKRQTRARFPNNNKKDKAAGYIEGIRGDDWPHKSAFYNEKEFTKKRWDSPQGAIFHGFANSYWGNLQWEIESVDYSKKQILFGKGGFQINDVMQGEGATGIGSRTKWYVENIFEELDAPGEWFHDRKKGILYLIPEEGVDPNSVPVVISHLKTLFCLKGSQEQKVKNITLSNLRLTHTSTTFLDSYHAPSLGDWTICRKGAVYLEGTEKCQISGCFFDQNGGNSLFFNRYNRLGVVNDCLFSESGDSGICLVGDLYETIGSQQPYPADMTISNNILHDLGEYGKQTAAVFVSVARRIHIHHNKMNSLPRAAVCMNDGTWGGHIIEYNDIFDTVKETGDHGPFNSWGRGRFWCLNQSHGPASHGAGDVLKDCQEPMIINQNRFEDYSGWGIDLDDGTSNTVVSNNLCIGISIKLREGDFRTVKNNIFIKGANPPGFHVGYEENSDRFLNNIILIDSKCEVPEDDVDFKMDKGGGFIYKFIFPPAQGPWFKEWDNNLFFSDTGEFRAEARLQNNSVLTYSLKEWQKKGNDKNSLYANPEFVDQEEGDFRLKPSSPAFKLGFKSLDYDQFGPQGRKNLWD